MDPAGLRRSTRHQRALPCEAGTRTTEFHCAPSRVDCGRARRTSCRSVCSATDANRQRRPAAQSLCARPMTRWPWWPIWPSTLRLAITMPIAQARMALESPCTAHAGNPYVELIAFFDVRKRHCGGHSDGLILSSICERRPRATVSVRKALYGVDFFSFRSGGSPLAISRLFTPSITRLAT